MDFGSTGRKGGRTAVPARSFRVRKNQARHGLYTRSGWYELYLNGTKVGEQVLAPPNSHYDRVDLYDTFDVTKLLRQNANAVGVILGGGTIHLFPVGLEMGKVQTIHFADTN